MDNLMMNRRARVTKVALDKMSKASLAVICLPTKRVSSYENHNSKPARK